MKPKPIKTRPRGFIVVVVLCTIILLTVLLLGFNYKSRNDLRAADNFRKSAQALNCAKAGLSIAIAVIRAGSDVNTNKMLKNLLTGEKNFAVADGDCSITAAEENGKLNINLLKNADGSLNRARVDRLLRLIDVLNREYVGSSHIPYDIVPSIIDWADTDDLVTCLPFVKYENSGAESDYYMQLKTPYKCKNRPLDSIEELTLVKGVTPEIFDRICNYLTVYGNGEININCASKQVIECLSEDIDPALAQMIINRRQIKPFDSLAELRDVPGITDKIYSQIRQVAAVGPAEPYYYIKSLGTVNKLSCTIVAVLRKNMETKNVEVVSYKEL